MAQKKYVSLTRLEQYHEKEVARVNSLISTAKDEANAYADSLAPNYDAAGTAATKAGEVQTKLNEEVTRAKAAEEANANAAKNAQDDVDALAGKVGEVADGSTVVGMIDAVDAIADANAADRSAKLENAVLSWSKGISKDTRKGLATEKSDQNPNKLLFIFKKFGQSFLCIMDQPPETEESSEPIDRTQI